MQAPLKLRPKILGSGDAGSPPEATSSCVPLNQAKRLLIRQFPPLSCPIPDVDMGPKNATSAEFATAGCTLQLAGYRGGKKCRPRERRAPWRVSSRLTIARRRNPRPKCKNERSRSGL